MRIALRPTVASDLAILERPLPHRIKGITAVLGDEVLGVGGLGYRPDGTVIAFVHMTEEARRYPVTIHRAGLAAIAMFRREGVPLVVAEAQPGNPAAERWLERLGFTPIETCGHKGYVWRPDALDR